MVIAAHAAPALQIVLEDVVDEIVEPATLNVSNDATSIFRAELKDLLLDHKQRSHFLRVHDVRDPIEPEQ